MTKSSHSGGRCAAAAASTGAGSPASRWTSSGSNGAAASASGRTVVPREQRADRVLQEHALHEVDRLRVAGRVGEAPPAVLEHTRVDPGRDVAVVRVQGAQ